MAALGNLGAGPTPQPDSGDRFTDGDHFPGSQRDAGRKGHLVVLVGVPGAAAQGPSNKQSLAEAVLGSTSTCSALPESRGD